MYTLRIASVSCDTNYFRNRRLSGLINRVDMSRAGQRWLLRWQERKQGSSNHHEHDNILRAVLPMCSMRYGLRRHEAHGEGMGKAGPTSVGDQRAMPGGMLHGKQQADPKRGVEAQEHRRDVAMSDEPLQVPQIVKEKLTPEGVQQAHHHQHDL